MLTLLLLRHAKAVAQPRPDDFGRPLTEKGSTDAASLGKRMSELDVLPDLSLVSSAVRTRQTFELFAGATGRPLAARYEAGLYDATDQQLRGALRRTDPAVRSLMVVGHNPGIMDTAIGLAHAGDPDDLARLRARFPPCGLAVITFDAAEWRDAMAAGGRLDLLSMPGDLA